MAYYPYQYVNRRGSAAVESTGVTVNAENVVFSFRPHAFLSNWYLGTVFVKLSQAVPAETTGTLPVVFETNGFQQAVTKYGGDPLTVADLPGTGVYELWYERSNNGNTLQVLTGVV